MDQKPIDILIIRMSALGDVAMTVPVIYSVKQQYPNATITVVSKPWVKPIFDKLGVTFIGFERREGLRGSLDIFKFFIKLRATKKWDVVIDLHDVIASKMLKHMFRLVGTPVKVINKGRKEKKALVRSANKAFTQLPSTFDRYAKVFEQAGLPIKVAFENLLLSPQPLSADIITITGEKIGQWIGIAPFAQHLGKVYPIQKMEEVVKHFSNQKGMQIILFGGGASEIQELNAWAERYPNTISVAGKIRLGQELLLMSHLDVMVSMDSANMHLASLVAVPVVSVWGATHPYAGFYGWNQPQENIVQENLPCRPCSVYGNKPCLWGDYRCMNSIPPQRIIDKINKMLDK